MNKAWPTKRLGELCTLINGRAFKPSDWSSQGLPIIRIQNLNDPSKPFNHFNGTIDRKHLIESGDILLSWSGTPGTSFGCFRWARGAAALNQHIFKVSVCPTVMDGDFFIHAVNSHLDEMIAKAHGGVGLRHITKGKLESIQLPVPPLSEQRRIVSRITECMELVEEREKLRAESLSEARQLAPALYEAIESESSWSSKRVGEVITRSRNGRSISPDNSNPTGYVLSLSSVRDVVLDQSFKKPIKLPASTSKEFSIHKGDVFVSRANTKELVGLASTAESSCSGLIYPDLLIKLETNPDLIIPKFLAYALRTRSSRLQIKERAVGSSQSMVKISAQRLREVEIKVPPLKAQEHILDELDEAHGLICATLAELSEDDSCHLRDAILRKAFAGEL
jgi:type I restriction enzyme S subunit